MELKDWAMVVGIMASIATGCWFVLVEYKKTLLEHCVILAKKWTDEGCIGSVEESFVTLDLQLENGDLIGSLESPQCDKPFEAHAHPGFLYSTLKISELNGRHVVPVARVRLQIIGNDNRLVWHVKKTFKESILPKSTVLWPDNV